MTSRELLRLAWSLALLIAVGMMVGLLLMWLGVQGYGVAFQIWGPS